jgi:phage gpG-like protein
MTVFANVQTEDISFTLETNFDYDKWEEYLKSGAVLEGLKLCKEYLDKAIRMRFVEEKGPTGKWPKLSELTVKYKGHSNRLTYKHVLERSFKSAIYGDEVILSTNVPYAKVHQYGSVFNTTVKQSYWMWCNLFGKQGNPFKSRTIVIPPRPFMGFTEENKNALKFIFEGKIKESERMGSKVV